jgi:hypothetical protein
VIQPIRPGQVLTFVASLPFGLIEVDERPDSLLQPYKTSFAL